VSTEYSLQHRRSRSSVIVGRVAAVCLSQQPARNNGGPLRSSVVPNIGLLKVSAPVKLELGGGEVIQSLSDMKNLHRV
jgi:hypothetical protein